MKKLLLASAITLATLPAQAEIRINGFANLVGGITGTDESLFGYDERISFDEESLFAVQVSGDINSKMTATAQVLARGKDGYEAELEWAYITYQATNNLSITGGRIRQPLFRYTTSSDIGYSYHWINTPQTVYDAPFVGMDGIRLDYSRYAGDWEFLFQASGGQFNFVGDLGSVNMDNLYVLSAEATWNWFKVRAVAGNTKFTISNPGLDEPLNLLRSFGLNGLADSLEVNYDSATFRGIGVEVDQYDWFIAGEYTIGNIENSFLQEGGAYYITAGIRTGDWTPSFTYEKSDTVNDLKFLDQLAGAEGEVLAIASGINAGLQLSDRRKFSVSTLAVRYDYDTNIALKADISRRSDDLDPTLDATAVRFAVNYIF